MKSYDDLSLKILEGNERALGKVISMIENQEKEGIEILKKLYKKGGKAKVVGFTGPPGAGKSTLIQCLALIFSKKHRVGIIAVDPTSPFTGGALLGDRIRMQNLFTNPNIFIRSMATRGSIGGLAPMTMDVVDLLDIAGYEWIFVETIGVGQDEVDVAMCVEEVVVVLVPGLGDEIQALKAGVMEIGDIFVINKADKEGADLTYMEIKNFFDMEENKKKIPKIIKTKAISMEGIDELANVLKEELKTKEKDNNLAEKKKKQLKARLLQMFTKEFKKIFNENKKMEKIIEGLFLRKTDPYSALESLKKEILC